MNPMMQMGGMPGAMAGFGGMFGAQPVSYIDAKLPKSTPTFCSHGLCHKVRSRQHFSQSFLFTQFSPTTQCPSTVFPTTEKRLYTGLCWSLVLPSFCTNPNCAVRDLRVRRSVVRTLLVSVSMFLRLISDFSSTCFATQLLLCSLVSLLCTVRVRFYILLYLIELPRL